MNITEFIKDACMVFVETYTKKVNDHTLICALTYTQVKDLGFLPRVLSVIRKYKYEYFWFAPEQVFQQKPFEVTQIGLTEANNIIVVVKGQESKRIYSKWKAKYAHIFYKHHQVELIWEK